jgi:paraquat-inducible protein B
MSDSPDHASPTSDSEPSASLPAARVRAARRPALVWVVPLLALLAGAFLVYQAVRERGRVIHIRFETGGGIQANDPVVFRGTRVGRVRGVELAQDLHGVVITAELRPDASALAVQGSKFWIVQPVVSMSRISGLETLLGPKYIEVEPGQDRGALRSDFVGLEREPVTHAGPGAAASAADDLSLLLTATVRPTVSVGSPVLYRGVKVGSVISFDLSATGQAVDVRVVIEGQYGHLVRSNSVFFNASGVDLVVGLKGLVLRAPSLESVVSGGVEFATPAAPGTRVENGTVFKLEAQPPKDAGEWSPNLAE